MKRHYHERDVPKAVIELRRSDSRINLYVTTRWDSCPRLLSLIRCLELGLPELEAKYGMASQEAAHVRELLAEAEKIS